MSARAASRLARLEKTTHAQPACSWTSSKKCPPPIRTSSSPLSSLPLRRSAALRASAPHPGPRLLRHSTRAGSRSSAARMLASWAAESTTRSGRPRPTTEGGPSLLSPSFAAAAAIDPAPRASAGAPPPPASAPPSLPLLFLGILNDPTFSSFSAFFGSRCFGGGSELPPPAATGAAALARLATSGESPPTTKGATTGMALVRFRRDEAGWEKRPPEAPSRARLGVGEVSAPEASTLSETERFSPDGLPATTSARQAAPAGVSIAASRSSPGLLSSRSRFRSCTCTCSCSLAFLLSAAAARAFSSPSSFCRLALSAARSFSCLSSFCRLAVSAAHASILRAFSALPPLVDAPPPLAVGAALKSPGSLCLGSVPSAVSSSKTCPFLGSHTCTPPSFFQTMPARTSAGSVHSIGGSASTVST
mmetsp:Transcript_14787/g.47158  ORF Transcript_14787/g.47158 Transcript_14787/m.47158 type:complete len:420 (-) Transcript_14787:620-1879(-)